MQNHGTFDACAADFPRLPGEKSDVARLRRAMAAAPRGVLYVPAGLYEIDETLAVTNLCSLLFHKSAVLRAVAPMEYILAYDAKAQHAKENLPEDYNLFVQGGDFDGRGLASCVFLSDYHHFTLSNITLRNGLKFGLKVNDPVQRKGYELIANNVYCRCNMPGLAGNVGIHTNGGDSHYTDCIVVDYTTGIEVSGGGANRFTRCHVWGGCIPPRREGEDCEMLVNSICFKIAGNATLLRDCYADTGKTGFYLNGTASLLGCCYYNNFVFKMDDTTVIRHEAGEVVVADCTFIKTSPKSRIYRGAGTGVTWRNNTYTGFDDADVPESDHAPIRNVETIYGI